MITWSKIVSALVLVALGVALGWFVTRAAWRADVAAVQSENAKVLQGIAESTAATANAVHRAYASQANAFAAIEAQHVEDKQHAQHDSDLLLADLRAGTVRLRSEWATCRATTGVVAAAGGAGADAGADDRKASAVRIIRAARDADDTIRSLQNILRAERAPAPAH